MKDFDCMQKPNVWQPKPATFLVLELVIKTFQEDQEAKNINPRFYTDLGIAINALQRLKVYY